MPFVLLYGPDWDSDYTTLTTGLIFGEYYNKDIAKKALGATIDAIQAKNADAKEREVMEDVTKIVESVRQERYEKGA